MILSVSRRTDIPNYYLDWFLQRLKEGFLYVRNPLNPRQISRITLSPEVVDCIVFWTKNPEPMLDRLEELQDYHYYVQFTLTGYGKDLEPGLPDKRETLIPVFQKLADRLGDDRVIWRYDPILFTDRYTPAYHLKAFEEIAGSLMGYARKVVISYVDWYAKMNRNMEGIPVIAADEKKCKELAVRLKKIAEAHHMAIAACAEQMDLTSCGIEPNCCIDKELIRQITGYAIQAKKDKNQRAECGCVESVEVGAYDSCRNGCRYCYANRSGESVSRKYAVYDVKSPLLCDVLKCGDRVTERKVGSLGREEQIRLLLD